MSVCSLFRTAASSALIGLLCLVVPHIQASSFEQLNFATEDYAPFNYVADNKIQGLAVELLQQIWRMEGLPREPAIALYPWARAWQQTLADHNHVLFTVARTPERENLFQWACPIFEARYVLLASKAQNIQINSPDDLQHYTLGAVRSDISEKMLIDMMGHDKNILSTSDMKYHLELLEKGRIHMIVYEQLSALKMLREAGRDPDDFEAVYSLYSLPLCFAFNKSVDPETVARFSQHLNQLRGSEQYHQILSRYLSHSG